MMVIKHKHVVKNNTINNITLRLMKFGQSSHRVYSLNVIHRKSRTNKGRVLAKIGFYNPHFDERCFFFDSVLLYYWLDRGLIVHYKVKNYLMKFLIPSILNYKININN